VREFEISRLDRLLTVAWDLAMSGNLNAIDRILKIQERRARYQGLDAPISRPAEPEYLDSDVIDAEVLRLVRILEQGDTETPIEVIGSPNEDF
jgi:hypothetical protein